MPQQSSLSSGVSFTCKELQAAFLAVESNHGCAGSDGVSLSAFRGAHAANLHRLQRELACGKYRPWPLLRIIVAKKNGEGRSLSIPAVRDRVAQRAVLDRIGPLLERSFEDSSFGYRPGRGVNDAVARIVGYYRDGFRWVVDADIDAFFDRVDHRLLIGKVRQAVADEALCRLIWSWVRGEVWDGRRLRAVKCGLPQGSALSPVLANLFLDELDERLAAPDRRYVRYADDFVILCRNPEDAARSLALSEEILAELALALDEKAVTSFAQGFHYLGLLFFGDMVVRQWREQKTQPRILYFPLPFNQIAYCLKQQWEGRRDVPLPD